MSKCSHVYRYVYLISIYKVVATTCKYCNYKQIILLAHNKTVPAFIDQFNTPTLVDDLCKVILCIQNLDLSGIYHAVGKTCLSRYDFALKLARVFGYNEDLIIPTMSSKVN